MVKSPRGNQKSFKKYIKPGTLAFFSMTPAALFTDLPIRLVSFSLWLTAVLWALNICYQDS